MSTDSTCNATQSLRILSLDGGGLRGLSSLIILGELMTAIHHKSSESKEPPMRPCDIFELIVGTGTGGISAILLGRLRLTVDQAIEEYVRMAENVFLPSPLPLWLNLPLLNCLRPMFNHKITLTDFLDEMVNRRLGDRDALFFDRPPPGQSQGLTAVLAATNANLDAPPYVFRSYSSNPRFKISDVARATSATTGMFPPVSLGFPSMQFVDAGPAGYNNPTETALDESRELWPERRVDLFLSIGTGSQSIVDASQDKLAELSRRLMSSCETVHDRVSNRLPSTTYFRFNVPRGLEDIGGMAWAERELPGRVAEITSAYLRKPEVSRNLTSCVQSIIGGRAPNGITENLASLSPSSQGSGKNVQIFGQGPYIIAGGAGGVGGSGGQSGGTGGQGGSVNILTAS